MNSDETHITGEVTARYLLEQGVRLHVRLSEGQEFEVPITSSDTENFQYAVSHALVGDQVEVSGDIQGAADCGYIIRARRIRRIARQ